MDAKKSLKADLRNKRGLLLEIGLVMALALVIYAFAYTPDQYRIEQVARAAGYVPEETIPVTRPEEERPQARKVEVQVLSDLLEIIDNDRRIQTDITFEDFDEGTEVLIPAVVEEKAVEDEVYIKAETMPSFMGGGLEAFRKWVLENVKFPQIALENDIHGKVTLSFVIEKDGRLTNIEVLQTPDRSLSEEAVRVLTSSPRWTPGKQRNRSVRVRYTLPVEFRVGN